jgi:hypothetical protein
MPTVTPAWAEDQAMSEMATTAAYKSTFFPFIANPP